MPVMPACLTEQLRIQSTVLVLGSKDARIASFGCSDATLDCRRYHRVSELNQSHTGICMLHGGPSAGFIVA
jgi:hypothetical protein